MPICSSKPSIFIRISPKKKSISRTFRTKSLVFALITSTVSNKMIYWKRNLTTWSLSSKRERKKFMISSNLSRRGTILSIRSSLKLINLIESGHSLERRVETMRTVDLWRPRRTISLSKHTSSKTRLSTRRSSGSRTRPIWLRDRILTCNFRRTVRSWELRNRSWNRRNWDWTAKFKLMKKRSGNLK